MRRATARVGLVAILGLALGMAACSTPSVETANRFAVEVVAEGLLAPIGLAEGAGGNIFVAEDGTGEDDFSGGISLITSDGHVRRVVDGFPSGRDSGDLSGAALVGVRDGTVYIGNFGAGHLWTIPEATLTAGEEPLGLDDLDVAMGALNEVRLTNPFDVTFDPDGRPVVADSSENGVATETDDGRTRFIHRFGELSDPNSATLKIDAVPTGIERVGDEYYVTLTGGCPYPAGAGQLVAIDGERNQRPVIVGLNMPIDVAQGPDGTVWVLEFAEFEEGASCFTGEGYRAGTGRLSRLVDGSLETVLSGLDYPGAVLPASDGSLYVSSVFGGEILRVTPPDGRSAPTPTSTPESAETRRFVDVAAEVGLDFTHGSFRDSVTNDPVAAMGGGVCWIDFDADGFLDLFLVNSYSLDEVGGWMTDTGLPTSRLYRNESGRFTSVSVGAELALRGNGCVAADFNADGWTDLYVTADGPNAMLINRDGTGFEEVAVRAGVAAPEWNSAAAAGDANGDGMLDLFVVSYIDLSVTIPKPTGHFPQDFYGLADHLYLAEGIDEEGVPHYREVTSEVGLGGEERGLGAVFADLDVDGDLDLYVTNDGNPNRLFLAEPGPAGVRYVDHTETAGVGDSGSGMGVATGDYDSDGLPDLLVTNWDRELNALYRNLGASDETPEFEYTTFRIGLAGLGNGQTGWGTSWLDVDLDTDLDLFIANGHVPVTDLVGDAEALRIYENRTAQGEPGQFRDLSERIGLKEVGPLMGRGSATADYDNDGDLDVVINSIGGPVTLLENQGGDGSWLVLDLDPAVPGAWAEVGIPGGPVLRRTLLVGSSYLASEDPRLHFGLGDAKEVTVAVHWPDGGRLTMESVPVDQFLTVSKP